MADIGTNVYVTLSAVRNALAEQIENAGLKAPCLVAVMPGQEVSLDHCDQCENGMAWVRLVTIARLESDLDAQGLGSCASGFTAVFEIGWMRGGPTVRVDGTGSVIEVPSEGEYESAAITQMADMTVMMNALCGARMPTGWKPKATGYTPFGPQGGCYGGLWSFTVPVD